MTKAEGICSTIICPETPNRRGTGNPPGTVPMTFRFSCSNGVEGGGDKIVVKQTTKSQGLTVFSALMKYEKQVVRIRRQSAIGTRGRNLLARNIAIILEPPNKRGQGCMSPKCETKLTLNERAFSPILHLTNNFTDLVQANYR